MRKDVSFDLNQTLEWCLTLLPLGQEYATYSSLSCEILQQTTVDSRLQHKAPDAGEPASLPSFPKRHPSKERAVCSDCWLNQQKKR